MSSRKVFKEGRNSSLLVFESYQVHISISSVNSTNQGGYGGFLMRCAKWPGLTTQEPLMYSEPLMPSREVAKRS